LLGKHHQLGLHTTQEFIWFIWVGSWWSLWAGESVNRTWWLAYPLLGKERSQPSPQTLSWAADAASLLKPPWTSGRPQCWQHSLLYFSSCFLSILISVHLHLPQGSWVDELRTPSFKQSS
jgi:hypothetical protein